MADENDMDLVQEFARHNSEAAFAELVHRHINLVYSVEGAFWARRNKPIWRASADPVGQPIPWPLQHHPIFLN